MRVTSAMTNIVLKIIHFQLWYVIQKISVLGTPATFRTMCWATLKVCHQQLNKLLLLFKHRVSLFSCKVSMIESVCFVDFKGCEMYEYITIV